MKNYPENALIWGDWLVTDGYSIKQMVLIRTNIASSPLLQHRFASRFDRLEPRERTQLPVSSQRIAAMMDAGDIDAAPLLYGASSPDAVYRVGR